MPASACKLPKLPELKHTVLKSRPAFLCSGQRDACAGGRGHLRPPASCACARTQCQPSQRICPLGSPAQLAALGGPGAAAGCLAAACDLRMRWLLDEHCHACQGWLSKHLEIHYMLTAHLQPVSNRAAHCSSHHVVPLLIIGYKRGLSVYTSVKSA